MLRSPVKIVETSQDAYICAPILGTYVTETRIKIMRQNKLSEADMLNGGYYLVRRPSESEHEIVYLKRQKKRI